jgi:hypothetical protein
MAKTVVAAAGGKRKQLQGTLFKYGPMSAQVLSLSPPSPPVRPEGLTPLPAAGAIWRTASPV